MNTLHDMIPEAEVVLELEPEELAGYLMEFLNSQPLETRRVLNRANFFQNDRFADYPQGQRVPVQKAWTEAWVWLEREGMLAPKPGSMSEGWVFITRRGAKLRDRDRVDAYRRSQQLPKQLLHPRIAERVWSLFLRGDYDTAVFQAFKEVEVAVRQAGGYHLEDRGTDLMRKAFHEDSGPLTDATRPIAERQALAHLFAGAIGSYKNPASHRHVGIGAEEAVEMIIVASHLLRIADERGTGAVENSSDP